MTRYTLTIYNRRGPRVWILTPDEAARLIRRAERWFKVVGFTGGQFSEVNTWAGEDGYIRLDIRWRA